MALKPEYYVIRLGRIADPNKDRVIPGQMFLPEEPPAQVAPRRNNRGLDLQIQAQGNEPPIPNNGYGVEINRSELRDPVVNFTTPECAEQYAQELAEKNPKTLYAVMGILKVYESAKSPIIEKKFNESGELVIVGGV